MIFSKMILKEKIFVLVLYVFVFLLKYYLLNVLGVCVVNVLGLLVVVILLFGKYFVILKLVIFVCFVVFKSIFL